MSHDPKGYVPSAALSAGFRTAGGPQGLAPPGRPGPPPGTAPPKDRVRGRVMDLRRQGLSSCEISAMLAVEGTPLNRTSVAEIPTEEDSAGCYVSPSRPRVTRVAIRVCGLREGARPLLRRRVRACTHSTAASPTTCRCRWTTSCGHGRRPTEYRPAVRISGRDPGGIRALGCGVLGGQFQVTCEDVARPEGFEPPTF